MEPTIIISLIAAIAAIVAPVFTAIINNRYNIKQKKIQAEEDRRKDVNLHEREVLEKALAGIGIIMSYYDSDSIKEACKNILTAVAYVDFGTGALLRAVVENVARRGTEKYNCIDYSGVCNALKEQIARRTGQ